MGPGCIYEAPLRLATSNLVYNLGLRISLPRNNFYDPNWRGIRARGASNKLGLLLISATVEASNFNFGIQHLEPKWAGVRAGEHPQKMWDPYLFLQPLKFKFGIQLRFGE